MLKRLTLIGLLFSAMLAGVVARPEPAAAVSCDPCPAYVTASLNLRASASLLAPVLTVMPGGATIEWYPTYGISSNGFARVRFGSTIGYAFADYLILYPLNGSTTAALNLRCCAGLGTSVLLVIPSGASVQILGGPSNGFYNVNYNGTVGWAYGAYLSFADPNVSWYPGETPKTLANLRLRSGAGTSFTTLAILPAGTVVTIISGPTFANGYSWYRVSTVSYGTGYVAGEFLGY